MVNIKNNLTKERRNKMEIHKLFSKWGFARKGLCLMSILALLILTQPLYAAEKVTLRLNWTIIGEDVGIFHALEKGFYTAEGIQLTVGEGTGAGNTVQLVGNKSEMFGLADASSLMLAAGKGLPVITVASIMNQSPFVIVSLEETGIRVPKDLEGKKIAATAGDALTQTLPAVFKANNVDQNKVGLVYMDPAAKIPAVMQKKIHALIGGTTAQAVQMETLGAKISMIKYADYGVNTVAHGLVIHSDMAKENPDLVRRMVRATTRGYEDALKPENEAAAIAATVKAKPGIETITIKRQWEETKKCLFSSKSENRIIGWASRADWEATLAILKEYRSLQTDRPVTSFYTNDFISKP
jgi:NitT/TauT family transport system substrate-binding protein